MNDAQILKVVEQFSRNPQPAEKTEKVVQLPDYKTIYIEQSGESGRSIMLSEYMVDGKSYWAGYSADTETFFVSKAYRG